MKNMNENIFWFDSETTGFNEKEHQMLSVAVVCTDVKFNVVDQYYNFIQLNPNTVITQQAMEVNKIDLQSPEYLSKALPQNKVMNDINNFIEKNKTPKSLSLAHNAPFDSRFIDYAMTQAELENKLNLMKILCTIKFFRKVINEGKFQTVLLEDRKDPTKTYWSAKLEHITKGLDIDHLAHNALGDTLGLIKAYKKAIFFDKGIDYFEIY